MASASTVTPHFTGRTWACWAANDVPLRPTMTATAHTHGHHQRKKYRAQRSHAQRARASSDGSAGAGDGFAMVLSPEAKEYYREFRSDAADDTFLEVRRCRLTLSNQR
jgi:hypothetical protein